MSQYSVAVLATLFFCLALFTSVLADAAGVKCYNDSAASDCNSYSSYLEQSSARKCCVEIPNSVSYMTENNECKQCIVYGFERRSYSVKEGESLVVRFGVDMKGKSDYLKADAAKDALVALFVGRIVSEPGTDLTLDNDYEEVKEYYSAYSADNGEMNIQVYAENDGISLEYGDNMRLRFIENPENRRNLETISDEVFFAFETIVYIIDNDPLMINFREADYSIEEGHNYSTIMLQLRRIQNPFTVEIHPVSFKTALEKFNFSASEFLPIGAGVDEAMEGDDFTNNSYTITIGNVTSRGTIETQVPQYFQVIDDNIFERVQSFALVAKLGPDVPEEFACFTTGFNDRECQGRIGATEIKIRDTDDNIVIGFAESSRTVSEDFGGPNEDGFVVSVMAHSSTPSEVAINFQVRLVSSGDIDVRAIDKANGSFDALFGTEFMHRLVEREVLPGDGVTTELPLIRIFVRNDLRSENKFECLALHIERTDIERTNIICEDELPTDFSCTFTLCIVDDDDPFEVAFVETLYTVIEGSVGQVEVCVNLTEPLHDIQDERVHVLVFDDMESVYIPPNTVMATPLELFSPKMQMRNDEFDYAMELIGLRGALITEEQRVVCYNQTVFDDDRLEEEEYFGLTLQPTKSASYPITNVAVPYHYTAVRIIDNDRAAVGWSVESVNVSEGAGSVTVCVDVISPSIHCPIQFPFTIHLRTESVTAESPEDYESLLLTLEFDACVNQSCVNVTINEDFKDEMTETFLAVVWNVSDTRIDLEPDTVEIHITDNDEPAIIGYSSEIYYTNETEGRVVLTIESDITAPWDFNVTVGTNSRTENITGVPPATPGVDYVEVVNELLLFEAGKDTVGHTISITEDVLCEIFDSEEDEEVFLSSILEVSAPGTVIVERQVTSIFISDYQEPECDPIAVEYDPVIYTTNETTGNVMLTIVVYSHPMEGAPRSFTLIVNTQDGTATVADGDYEPVSGQIIQFNRGDVFQNHNITINDDEKCEDEPNENFLSNISLEDGIRINVAVTKANITINDSSESECGVIEVGYEHTVYTTTEEEESITLTVVVSNFPSGTPRQFTLLATTNNGSADESDYFGFADFPLVFEIGSTNVSHTIDIKNDVDCEIILEDFFSNLSLLTGKRINITQNRARIIINDTTEEECEPIEVGYDSDEYVITESDGSVTLTVRVFSHPGGAPRPFNLVVNTENGTATVADGDYVPVSGQIIQFNRGDVNKTHTISIGLDEECENPSEFFFSNIEISTGIPTITVTVPRTKIIIEDRTEPECGGIVVGYNRTGRVVTEAVGIVELCAVVMNFEAGTPRAFTLTAILGNGTAVPGSDYVDGIEDGLSAGSSASGSGQGLLPDLELVFNVGDTFVCHTIHIIDDDDCELHYEKFFSELVYVSGKRPIMIMPETAEIVINDTDQTECESITVGYAPDTYGISESAGSVTLTISISSHADTGAPRPLTLFVSTEDGTADAEDYGPEMGHVIQFNRGDVNKTHTISIVDDYECETDPNEYFFSDITLDSGAVLVTVTVPRATVTIDDSEQPECGTILVGYERTTYVATEKRSASLCAVILSHNGSTPRDFILNATTEDGSAAAGDDYESGVFQLAFEIGDKLACHNVQILDDESCEYPTEDFFSNLVYHSGEMPISISPNETRIIINDTFEKECEILVGYQPHTYTPQETNVTLSILVLNHLMTGTPRPFALFVNTINGTTTAGEDYVTVTNEIIEFDVNDTTKSHTIVIHNDMKCEDEAVEQFFSSISLVDPGLLNIIVDPNQATVTIDDSSEPECGPIVVGFEFPVYTTPEGTVEYLCAVVMNFPDGTPRPFTINFTTEDGTAVYGSDYAAYGSDYGNINDVEMVFGIGTRSVCVPVQVVDDRICELEPNEHFFAKLEYDSGKMPIIISRNSTRVIINDSAEPECAPITVGYVPVIYGTNESYGYVFLDVKAISHPGGVPRSFTLAVNTKDGTAIAGDDYDPVSGELIEFNAGDVAQTHNITIKNDEECEHNPNEYFHSNITLQSGVGAISIQDSVATVTIWDEAKLECGDIVVGYHPFSYTINEGEENVTLTIVVLSHPRIGAPRSFILVVSTENGTATVADGDYVPVSDQMIQFNRGDVTQTHTITINDDDLCEKEPNENFFSNIALASGIPDIDVTVRQATITINDTAEPECGVIEVGYEHTVYNTTEERRNVTLCVVVRNFPSGTPRSFTLLATTGDGSAVSGDDYVGVSGVELTFEIGDRFACHSITIIGDEICEYNDIADIPIENFVSYLEYGSGVRPIDIIPRRTMVTITDMTEAECAPVTVGYDPVTYQTSEGVNLVNLTIRVFTPLATGAPRPFTVVVDTVEGTATVVDNDYEPVSGQIIQFNRGDVTQTHTITINDDDECEEDPNENFFSTLTLGVGVGQINFNRPQAEVTINDTDEYECYIRVGYEMTVYTTPEGDTTVELCAIIYEPIMNGPSPRHFILSYQTSDGNTLSGDDYVSSAGVLEFSEGNRSQCHSVEIVDDERCERHVEHFFSTLSLSAGREVIVIYPRVAQIEISDSKDCRGVFVNDTLTGDPLMIVPIFTDPDVKTGDEIESLCYEVHGRDDTFFNLISDRCTSVNAYYQKAITPSSAIDLNVVTRIGVRAVGERSCWNIDINLHYCTTTVNGMVPETPSFDGIKVKQFSTDRSRIRISVPNCASSHLVMWVFCQTGNISDPDTPSESYTVHFLRFVITRGLNLSPSSHGLIGQFWNVPVEVEEYEGSFNGDMRDNVYEITVEKEGAPRRHFLGLKQDVTWDFRSETCYYVGNVQGGVIGEDLNSDPVIEGDYTEYTMDSLFDTEYNHTRFDQDLCT